MNEARSESVLQRPVEKWGFRLFSISIFAWKEPSRKAASACLESAPLCNPRRETSSTPAPTQKTTASTNSDRLFIFPPQRAASMNETNSCKRRGVLYSPLTTCTPPGLHPHVCRELTAALGAACRHTSAQSPRAIFFLEPVRGTRSGLTRQLFQRSIVCLSSNDRPTCNTVFENLKEARTFEGPGISF